jgi:hypothetical protein
LAGAGAAAFHTTRNRKERVMTNWRYTLKLKDVFHDDERTFEERRDEVVKRIKAAPFYSKDWEFAANDFWWIEDIVERIEESTNGDEFDVPWMDFYDLMDIECVWVETF